eukprot:gene20046-36207_t
MPASRWWAAVVAAVLLRQQPPGYAASVAAQCADPAHPLRAELRVSSAWVGHLQDPNLQVPGPSIAGSDGSTVVAADLYLLAQWCDGAAGRCSGGYALMQGALVNGETVWEKTTGDHWMYSTPKGFWCVTDSQNDFSVGAGYLHTQRPHGGAGPEGADGWQTGDGPDGDIVACRRPPEVHGWRVGQRVTCSEDVTEHGRLIVRRGEVGVVRGGGAAAAGAGVRVRFRALTRDVVLVAEELDAATGPPVRVLEADGEWADCVIVNATDTHLKVHRPGRGHDDDEWLEKASARIERASELVVQGDRVALAPAAPDDGCLRKGEAGTLLRDAGPHRPAPLKVRGPRGDASWYAVAHV